MVKVFVGEGISVGVAVGAAGIVAVAVGDGTTVGVFVWVGGGV
jgi:hypothetical protein